MFLRACLASVLVPIMPRTTPRTTEWHGILNVRRLDEWALLIAQLHLPQPVHNLLSLRFCPTSHRSSLFLRRLEEQRWTLALLNCI